MGYFMDSHRDYHYVEPWEDRLASCLVIDLDAVTFGNDCAWGYVRTPPTTTSGFFFTWDYFRQKFIFKDGEGFLTRWDTGDYMLIIPIREDEDAKL